MTRQATHYPTLIMPAESVEAKAVEERRDHGLTTIIPHYDLTLPILSKMVTLSLRQRRGQYRPFGGGLRQ